MPIYLVTGQPRNGKTLWTLWHVRKFAEKEKRTVYYNIGDEKGGTPKLVKIPGWVHLENPEDWHRMPDNSIIVIDEAQRPFRPRSSASKVPEHVSLLETHGHHGFDLFFITQHPGLIEGNVLRLVQTHRHVKRLWGAQAATVHEWDDVNKNPDQSRAGSLSTTWRYPKDVFEVYESATHHTVKARPPLRLFIMVLFFLAAPALLGYSLFRDRGLKPTTEATGGSKAPTATTEEAQGGAYRSPVSYVAAQVPRVPGLAYTAPAYDELTKPVSAPFPAGCIASATRCTCYTEQGTRLDVPQATCESAVQRGFFQFWRPSPSADSSPSGGAPPSGSRSPSTTPLQAAPVGRPPAGA